MERVLNLRKFLVNDHMDLQDTQKLKDIMFLDLALESYTRTLTESIMHIDIGINDYLKEVGIILSNLELSYDWSELKYLREDWEALVNTDLTEENARKIKSVIDRCKQCLGEVNDVYEQTMQAKGEMMGRRFNAADHAVKLFSEDLLRGTLFFSLSMILKKIDPHIREQA